MAEIVPKPETTPSAADQAAEELQILNPDAVLQILGETITVREYSHVEQLALKPRVANLSSALAALISASDDTHYEEIEALFEDYEPDVSYLISQSIDKPESYRNGLPGSMADQITVTWWVVNRGFFIKSARRVLRALEKQQNQSAGQTSTLA